MMPMDSPMDISFVDGAAGLGGTVASPNRADDASASQDQRGARQQDQSAGATRVGQYAIGVTIAIDVVIVVVAV